MADTRGVFIFDQVVEQKLEGEWVPVEDVWSDAPPIETSDVGYWGGGFKELFPSSGYYSSTDKCDFSTDTTTYTPSANISSSIDLLYANGNSTHGYFCGGYRTTAMSIVDKLTYTIDTTARTPSADMPVSRYALAVISNRENGYIAGGFPGPSGGSTYIFKLSYSTDTTSRINSDLPANSAKHATVGTVTKGFFCGGEYNNKSNVDRIEYTNETVSRIPGADMSTGMEYHGGSGNSDAGYLTGGYHYPNIRSSVDKLTYSTETTARIPNANLTASRYKHAASGNPTHGYIGGGDTGSDSSSMDKLSYSSETTTSVPNAHLSAPKRVLASTGPRINGYGSSPIPNPLTIRYIDATPITPVFGYFGGGTPGPGAMSTMDKVTYANDTTATVPGANLNVARSYLAATGNSTHGYFSGGTSPIKSTMERVTYASDTTAAVPGANLSLARYDLAATGNSTHGYFGGGLPGPGSISTMDKTTYSTDTTAAVPGANFNSGRGEHAATGNPEAGYFAGGGSLTSIEKTTYSTDTTASTSF